MVPVLQLVTLKLELACKLSNNYDNIQNYRLKENSVFDIIAGEVFI